MAYHRFVLCLLSVVLLGAASAQAAVIRYTFQNTTFTDGGTVTGYFDWDTSLPSITSAYDGASVNFAVTVAGGDTGTFPAFTYTDEVEGPMQTAGMISGNLTLLSVGNLFGTSSRALNFIPDTQGGTVKPGVDLNISLFISNNNSVEGINPPLSFRQMAAGSLVGQVIPEPASAALLALGGVWLVGRRRSGTRGARD